LVRPGNNFQAFGDPIELVRGQSPCEVGADPAEVGVGSATKEQSSLLGESHLNCSGIHRKSLANDKTISDEAIHTAGECARRGQDAFGEFRHPQSVFWSPSKPKKHVIRLKADPMVATEFGVEQAHNIVMSVQ